MSGDDDEGATDQAAGLEFLEEQAGHNGLSGAGVVGQEEADVGLAQDVVVDGLYLVGQGVHLGDVDGSVGLNRSDIRSLAENLPPHG